MISVSPYLPTWASQNSFISKWLPSKDGTIQKDSVMPLPKGTEAIFTKTLVNRLIDTSIDALHYLTSLIQSIASFILRGAYQVYLCFSTKTEHVNSSKSTKKLGDFKTDELNEIFKKFEAEKTLDFTNPNPEIKTLLEDPEFWKLWAERLSVPLNQNEDAQAQIKALLLHFKVDPSTGKLSILKNLGAIKTALKVYPAPAYFLHSAKNTLNFYCRNVSGDVIEYLNIDIKDPTNDIYQKIQEIINDRSYTAIKL